MRSWTLNVGSVLVALAAALLTFMAFRASIQSFYGHTPPGLPVSLEERVAVYGVSSALAVFVAWVVAVSWRLHAGAGVALILFTAVLLLCLQYYIIVYAGYAHATLIEDLPARVSQYVQRAVVPWVPPVALGVSLVGEVASFVVCVVAGFQRRRR